MGCICLELPITFSSQSPDFLGYNISQNSVSTRKTETGPPLPFPPLPSVTFFYMYYTVLYCTILYYTVLYCTILYSQSPVSSPSLQKFTCLETLMGGTRMNADILFSLLRGSLATLSTSLRSVVTQCRLHTKTKKWPGQLERERALTHRWRAQWHGVDMILFYLIEKDHGDCSFICPLHATVRGRWFANGHYYLIQVKNWAWSPSLPFFPSLLCHVFYIILKNKK